MAGRLTRDFRLRHAEQALSIRTRFVRVSDRCSDGGGEFAWFVGGEGESPLLRDKLPDDVVVLARSGGRRAEPDMGGRGVGRSCPASRDGRRAIPCLSWP